MRRSRPRLLALLALALPPAAGLAGCGLGAGNSDTGARVLVTRDFGTRQLGARIAQDLPSSETVMRLLQRNFDVKTRYGGGFVQSIGGLAGGREGGRPVDWFFYVNGIESDTGAADVQLHDGDRIWWDRHDWGATPHVPAVVGSFPEPFAHGADGKRYPVVLECADDVDDACKTVSDRLSAAGVIAGRQTIGTGVGERTVRVFVGALEHAARRRRARPARPGPGHERCLRALLGRRQTARPARPARRDGANARRGRRPDRRDALRAAGADVGDHRHRHGRRRGRGARARRADAPAPLRARARRLPGDRAARGALMPVRRSVSPLHAVRAAVGCVLCAVLALPALLFDSPLVLGAVAGGGARRRGAPPGAGRQLRRAAAAGAAVRARDRAAQPARHAQRPDGDRTPRPTRRCSARST